jgi:hypothetical protein
MYQQLFEDFLESGDSLRIYQGERLCFSSTKDRLIPLLEYLGGEAPADKPLVIFDKIVGNAAALLAIKAGCGEIFSPLASQLATKTLDKCGVKYKFSRIVPVILEPGRPEMCPMEELSIGKTPEEFYQIMKKKMSRGKDAVNDG